MPEISEGDTVITPDGIVCKVVSEAKSRGNDWATEHGYWKEEKLIKANAPLRVKVTSEHDAEALVGHARDRGFEWNHGFDRLQYPESIRLDNEDKIMSVMGEEKYHDLTYPSDSDQVLAYLSYHDEELDDE